MTDRIAILGWGSLLWDKRPGFDRLHGPWEADGPILRIEFSRISSSRLGALTLVLDPVNGTDNRVTYCQSLRNELSQAVNDVRAREGTIAKNIGYIGGKGRARSRDQRLIAVIASWAAARRFDSAVWTDLPSNFSNEIGKQFSPQAALAYLNSLDTAARDKAEEYICRAPEFIRTPFRRAFMSDWVFH